jgi:BolA protein
MTIQETIETKLETISPQYLEVVNESGGHNVPAGSETHFKVVVVADCFDGERLINRHRRINTLLAEELAGGVHALGIHAYTEAEWTQRFGEVPASPACHGGGADGGAK